MSISMLLSLWQAFYTISIILYYANQPTLCQFLHTMSIILYYVNHFIYYSHYIPTFIWHFLQLYILAIFVIIFIFQTETHINFVCNCFLKTFLFKSQKNEEHKKKLAKFATCRKNWYLRFGSPSFGDTLSPSTQCIYISQIISYFVSTMESKSLRYTSCHLQALIRFSKFFLFYFLIISPPKITS